MFLAGVAAAGRSRRGQKVAKVRGWALEFRFRFILHIQENLRALRLGLHEHGYVEGQDLIIESRWPEDKSDRLVELAAELVRLKNAVLVAHGTPATIAALRATEKIPYPFWRYGGRHHYGRRVQSRALRWKHAGSTYFKPGNRSDAARRSSEDFHTPVASECW